MSPRLTIYLILLALAPPPACPQASASAPPPAVPAYESDPKYQAAIKEAKEALHTHQYIFAVEAYKKANKAADGQCARCLDDAYTYQMRLGNFKDAISLANQLDAIAATPRDKSIAVSDRAHALLRQAGDKPKPAQLEAVHAAYQAALIAFPKNLAARFADACVLTRLGKLDDASHQFSACAEAAAPTDPTRLRARHFAEDPSLSLAKMAPAFTVTALDGSQFTLDEMGGRVVLIDFWATWCGPCNEELPHMRKIAQEFAGQPLVILSISWDDDEAKWKAFLQKNGMTWPQYRDADHTLSARFGVQAIPHYFTIDSDGVLTAEMLGSGSDVKGKLKKLLARARPQKPAIEHATGK